MFSQLTSAASWELGLLFPLPQGPAAHSRASGQQGGRSLAVTPSVLTRLWLPYSGSLQCPVPPFTPNPTYLGSLVGFPHPQSKLLSQLLTQLSDIFILWKAGRRLRYTWWARLPRPQSCAPGHLVDSSPGSCHWLSKSHTGNHKAVLFFLLFWGRQRNRFFFFNLFPYYL